MNKIIQNAVILFQLVFASGGFCDQEKLEVERTQKLQVVFESIQQGNKTKLASCLPGLSEEEASQMLRKISEHRGDAGKLVKMDNDRHEMLDKGKMKTVVHWGTAGTQIGKWFSLESPEAKGTLLRIGLLFPKGSSEAGQFLAVEWDDPGDATDERAQDIDR